LKKLKPDIVYINEHVLFQFALASKVLKIPTYTHLRSLLLNGTVGLRKRFVATLLSRLNRNLFAITSEEANQIEKYSGITSKIIIVNEFLDEDNYKTVAHIDQEKITLGIPLDRVVVLMLGGYEPIKGTLETLRALRQLVEKKIKVYFLIVGTVNKGNRTCRRYARECFDYIDKYNLGEHLLSLPYSENPHKFIAICDILISPSTVSHFSRPIIEAWAQLKGVISSDTPHARYFIEDRKDGILFSAGDAKDLAEKIENLIYDKKLYTDISRNGHMKAQNMFNADINCSSIFRICDIEYKKK
jgi:glycosyltransferase involved in cell wall biosynthesis